MKCIKHVDFINLPFLGPGQRYIHCRAQQALFSPPRIVTQRRRRSEWFQNERQQKLHVYGEQQILTAKRLKSLTAATL